MMFSNKLFKIYSTRFIGIIASILSYIIVIPKLSSNTGSYGIYSVVVSLLMLLQYADLGFLGAGQKYAAECFAKNDIKEEIKILSFVHFILFVVVIFYTILLIYIYYNTNIIFNNLTINDEILAKKLILIFILFSPLIVIQRFVSAVFTIRIEDYIQQFVDITGNLFKIASTYYFFNNNYNIVGYILFIQIINVITSIINLVIIKKKYKYDFSLFLKSFKFNKRIYEQSKNMAFTSVILTITWLIYYELDSLYVSKLYNPNTVAFFAIGITILTFSRTLMNVFFSPFQVKFNHLIGAKDENLLSVYFTRLIEWSFPISIIPTVCIFILMKPLILSWVGFNYSSSIIISKIFILNLLFAFLLVPINYLAMAREKFRFLIISAASLPFFYIIIFLLIRNKLDYVALPIAKLITILINLLLNLYLIKTITTSSLNIVIIKLFKYILLPLFLMSFLLFVLMPYWDLQNGKNIFIFLKIIAIGSICVIFPILLYYLLNPYTRIYVFKLFSFLKLKYKIFFNCNI